jgi:hypothetical protein
MKDAVIQDAVAAFRYDCRSRSTPAIAMLLAPIILAACGTSGGSIAPSSIASATPAVVIEPTSTPAAIASSTPAATYSAAAEAGPLATIADPDLALELPLGWNEMAIPTFRTIVETSASGSPQEVQVALAALLRDIDDGSVRLVAGGPTGFGQWSGTMTFQVDAGDASLDAALARIERRTEGLAERASFEEHAVSLPIGAGIRRGSTYAVDPGVGGVPSQVIEYVVRLVDGRTLWVMATAPEAAEGFDALIDRSAGSLRTG